jgi:hypothetical protein
MKTNNTNNIEVIPTLKKQETKTNMKGLRNKAQLLQSNLSCNAVFQKLSIYLPIALVAEAQRLEETLKTE